MAQRALVGGVHHSKLVPDTDGNLLNEKVPTSILNGPSWSKESRTRTEGVTTEKQGKCKPDVQENGCFLFSVKAGTKKV